MNKPALGFLTPPGLVASGVTILIVVLITIFAGGIIYSPGPLNSQAGGKLGGYSSHAEFTGECALCHAPFWQAAGMDTRCLACHTTTAEQMVDPASLHASIYRLNHSITCRDCHPDHRGPSAPLTDVRKAIFPHELLGYSLAGHVLSSRGEPFTCVDCHVNDLTTFDQTACKVCHEGIDSTFTLEHVQTFGLDCLACHDGIDTYGDLFDHDLYPFPLEGVHAGTPCSACHTGARSIPYLQAAPVACFACHADKDVHDGTLGSDCASCHTPTAWVPSIYDHDLSIFPLEGKHVGVPCATCHVGGIFKGTPTDCFSCHSADDPHGGRFGTDCGACHNLDGWSPALFDHNLAAFKLTGAHVSAACEACHIDRVWAGIPSTCVACHAGDDAHDGTFGTGCATCHSTVAWLPAYFDHNLTAFPLKGAHAGLACARCHSSGIFNGLATACAACHADPAFHAGLFSGIGCDQCHNSSAWTPASFPLSHPGGCDGPCISHEGASCRDCHTSSLASATCAACHDGNPGDGGDDD